MIQNCSLCVLLLAPMSAMAGTDANGIEVGVEAIRSDSAVRFFNLESRNKSGVLSVSGRVYQGGRGKPVVAGHLDVDTLGEEGKVLLTEAIDYQPLHLNKKRRRASRFMARFDAASMLANKINIRFHAVSLKRHGAQS